MTKAFTNMRSLMGALARALNLVNPDMEHHHEQTAYLAYQIGYRMGLRDEALYETIYVALLHDIGSVVWPEQQNVENIEAHSIIDFRSPFTAMHSAGGSGLCPGAGPAGRHDSGGVPHDGDCWVFARHRQAAGTQRDNMK